MNYDEIVQLALNYSDRTDADITTRMDDFLRVAESRINRKLRTMNMTSRSIVQTEADQQYYGLPYLFGGLRDIEIKNTDATKGQTLGFVTPEQMNALNNTNVSGIFYTLVANQIQIYPPQDGMILEVIYYQRLDPLTPDANENWLSERYPDVYVFALLVEIEAFVKNAEGAMIWNERLKTAIDEMELEDSIDRWSGTPLTIKLG